MNFELMKYEFANATPPTAKVDLVYDEGLGTLINMDLLMYNYSLNSNSQCDDTFSLPLNSQIWANFDLFARRHAADKKYGIVLTGLRGRSGI